MKTEREWRESGQTRMSDAQRRMLNAEDVRALLSYEPDTGILRWKWHMTPRARAGKEAGVIQRGRYRRIGIFGRYYMAHRLAWLIVTGSWPINEIDHINGICSDNRLCNLREATCAQNKQNTIHKNSNGLLGAAFHSGKGRYRATIHANGVKRFLGWYDTAEEAHAVYVEAARIYHGEFASCLR